MARRVRSGGVPGKAPHVVAAVLWAPPEHGVPTLLEMEAALVERAIRIAGTKQGAATALGIDRRTLYRIAASARRRAESAGIDAGPKTEEGF